MLSIKPEKVLSKKVRHTSHRTSFEVDLSEGVWWSADPSGRSILHSGHCGLHCLPTRGLFPMTLAGRVFSCGLENVTKLIIWMEQFDSSITKESQVDLSIYHGDCTWTIKVHSASHSCTILQKRSSNRPDMCVLIALRRIKRTTQNSFLVLNAARCFVWDKMRETFPRDVELNVPLKNLLGHFGCFTLFLAPRRQSFFNFIFFRWNGICAQNASVALQNPQGEDKTNYRLIYVNWLESRRSRIQT